MKDNYQYKVSASGRVNLIGEHVDYCGGKVFPAALSLKNDVYIRPNGTDKINLSWTTLNDKITLDIHRLDEYKNVKYANYIAGSLWAWQKAGNRVIGADMLFECRVPFGSGLSSSAAIEVSTIAAMATITNTPLDKPVIALAAQRAEREYAGVNCGIMDQYASACGVKGHAMLLDCSTLFCEQVPVDLGEYSLVIINCNKPHNLVESKYNERRAETEEALKILQTKLPIKNLAEVTIEQFDEYGRFLNGKVFDRAKHVVFECDRVNKASAAMKSGDIKTLGKLLNESHNSLRDLYEVTGRELDTLQKAALSSPYCIGSRMTGAGFGGCTVSLVKTANKSDFETSVVDAYLKEIGYAPSVYEAEIDDGITVEKL
ncbi:MAG: galactokinase [Clostridia bacterium]|nr:galactokinase [Clostridia bacterium]